MPSTLDSPAHASKWCDTSRGQLVAFELVGRSSSISSGALDKKMLWFSCFSSAWNEQGLDLEMGRRSLVFLMRFSYLAV